MTETLEAKIAWTDVETTGLDTRDGHLLLQIAIIITDKDFNEIAVLEQKFRYSPAEVAILKDMAPPIVQEMHEKTGLWDALPDGTPLDEYDDVLLRWLQRYQPKARELYFGGNSITLDREFIREFLPKSYNHLHYRSLDMTSVETFKNFTEDRPWFEKRKVHDALEDIRESIASAKYQRELDRKG